MTVTDELPTTAAAPKPDHAGSWRQGNRRLAVDTAVGTVVLVASMQLLTPGYMFGYGEQVLLSMKGISWADPTAFVNDWFNDAAPQPHVLYDVITWFAESILRRAEVYFLLWVGSLAAFALATALLAEVWLPAKLRWLQFLVLVLAAAGPNFALGTFLDLHFEAVPNGIGGCLGLLSAALLLRARWRLAAVAAVATTAIHIQHGFIAAALLLAAFVFADDRRRVRAYPLVIALIAAIVLGVSLARGLFVGNTDFADVCELASPGHCNPETWSVFLIASGVAVLALGAAAVWLAPTRDRLAVVLVTAPALTALTALVSDLLDVPVLADLSRRIFAYRFVMAVAPFACWAVVLLFARAWTARRTGPARAFAVLGVFALLAWLNLKFAHVARPPYSSALATWVGLGTGVAAAALLLGSRPHRHERSPNRRLAPVLASVVLVAGLPVAGIATGSYNHLAIGYHDYDGAPALGAEIAAALPVGSVLASPPNLYWVPLLTRRAVVGTCKHIPYGGAPWREYRARMAALGVPDGYGFCSPRGYYDLGLDDFERLATEFGATHVLVVPDNRSYAAVRRRWPVVWESGGTMQWVIAEIPAGGRR